MAKYWVGGTGNTNDPTNHWATTSGGSPGAGNTPTAADDVYFDANSGSGTVTINAALPCRSIQTSGSSIATIVHNAATTVTIGDATAGAGNIAFDLSGITTYTLGNATTSALSFVSTNGTAQSIISNGKTLGNMTFNGSGGSWLFSGNLTSTGTISHILGTLDFNSVTVSVGIFSGSGTGTRVLTLGSSAITITSSSGWAWGAVTGLTVTANTATATLTNAGAVFNGANKDWNGLSVAHNSAGFLTVTSTGFTIANLTRTGTAVKTDSMSFTGPVTITGTLTLNGNSAINRLFVVSSLAGTARTITAATVSASNVDFRDITGAGAASWDLSAITGGSGDAQGNSGITFTTAATQTRLTGGAGDWDDVTRWSSRVPLPQDNVIVAVGTGQLSMDMPRLGADIDFTGYTGSIRATVGVSIYGSLTLASGMTFASSNEDIILSGRGTHTLKTFGKTISMASNENLTFGATSSGSYTLQDDLTVTVASTGGVGINNTFNTDNYNVTVSGTNDGISIGSAATINGGTSTFTINTTGTGFWVTNAGATINMSSSTIVLGAASTGTRTFAGGSKTYGTLTYTVAGSTGILNITGSNTFTTINFSDVTNARTLQFTASTTTTYTNFNVNGTSGKLMTIGSITAASHTLAKAGGGTISCDYLSISRSTATPGSTWYAGTNSTDAGNNSGWIFTAPPAGGSDIKTFNGIAIASVKTFNGIAIANIKTWNGISNV